MLINALNVIQIIIVKNYFLEIIMDNAYVKKDIMMIIIIVTAKNAQIFGN